MPERPLEKSIESTLRRAVEDEGGLCLKWVCPGHRGVPDRMLLFPGGVIAFVELKRPGAKVKAGGLQNWWRDKLSGFGFACYEISTAEHAKHLVSYLSTQSFMTQAAAADDTESDWADDAGWPYELDD